MTPTRPNLLLLQSVWRALGPLQDQVMLVGGCATDLLITDPLRPATRATIDVDLVVDAVSYLAYAKLEEQLRGLGFRQTAQEDGVICRWHIAGCQMDLMPMDKSVLGFGNPWYAEAYAQATQTILPDGQAITHATAPGFIATKLEAYASRGNGDYGLSHDIEDIITVLDGRPELLKDLHSTSVALRQHLQKSFAELLSTAKFTETLHWHLPPDAASQARERIVLERMKAISAV